MDWEEDEGASMVSKKEYDCAICNQTTLSTAENPMGLVVLLQVCHGGLHLLHFYAS